MFTHKMSQERHVLTTCVFFDHPDYILTYWEEFIEELKGQYSSTMDTLNFTLMGYSGSIALNCNKVFSLNFGALNVTYETEYLLDAMEELLNEARRLWYADNI